MGHLYKLEFSNSKLYIGISTRSPDVRFKEHRMAALNNKASQAVCRAWRKHGEPKMTVLAFVKDSELYETEKRAISAYATLTPNGYNLTLGGEGSFGYKHTNEAILTLFGNSHRLGHKHSKETKTFLSMKHTGNTYGLGHKHSSATRDKMSVSHSGVQRPDHSDDMKSFWSSITPEKKEEMRVKSSEAMRRSHADRKLKQLNLIEKETEHEK